MIFRILLPLLIFLTSCSGYKRLTYLRGIEDSLNDSIVANYKEYQLKPADVLYVQMSSPNEDINKLLNFTTGGSTNNSTMLTGSMYYFGFTIDADGTVQLPVIGKVKAAGYSIAEVKQNIDSLLKVYVTDYQINVKLAEMRITFLGEVKSPGIKFANQNRINIFEALAFAGDITYNGNRSRIVILRPYDQGTKVIKIDLTNPDILTKPEYFVQNNDVVYVQPLKTTLFRERISDYTFLISTVASTISLIVLVIAVL